MIEKEEEKVKQKVINIRITNIHVNTINTHILRVYYSKHISVLIRIKLSIKRLITLKIKDKQNKDKREFILEAKRIEVLG